MQQKVFRDQVVIVIGASSGIGKALALQLAGQGAKVVIAARRVERLEEVTAEYSSLGGEVLAVPTDVSDEAQCKLLVEKTIETFGRLNMLVNNAGLVVLLKALVPGFLDWLAIKLSLEPIVHRLRRIQIEAG